jgi:hypothetical protein
MNLKSPLLVITVVLAFATGGTQATTVCDIASCAYADTVIDPQGLGSPAQTKFVTAIVLSTNPNPDAAYDAVLGVPVDPDDGVRLVAPTDASPNDDSLLTLHLADTVKDTLWVYSLAAPLGSEMRFELFVSGDGNFYQRVTYPIDMYADMYTDSHLPVAAPLSVQLQTFFENDNAPIDISGYGDINFVQVKSLLGDSICAAGVGPQGCKAYAQSMQVNGVAGLLANAVPVPAAVWLFGSGLIGLLAIGRRRRQS